MKYFNGIETLTITQFNESQFVISASGNVTCLISLNNMQPELKEKVIKHFYK